MRHQRRLCKAVDALMVCILCVAIFAARVRPAEAGFGEDEAEAGGQITGCVAQLDQYYISERKRMEREEQALWQQQSSMEQEEAADRKELVRTIRQEVARREAEQRQIADLVPEQYQHLVIDVADRFDLDPRLLAAVGSVESQWYARATGSHGDSGLMQIIPSTANWIAGKMGFETYDIFDPTTNLTMGAWYLRTLYTEYGTWGASLAAYNGGPRAAGAGDAHPYARRVLGAYHRQGS